MSPQLDRRRLLAGVATSVTLLAGCRSGDSSGDSTTPTDEPIRDSDDDGVIDSEDYAPQDPSVQERSDLTGTTKAAAPTVTPASTSAGTATDDRSETGNPTESSSPTPATTATPTPTPTTSPTPSPTPSPTASPTPSPTPSPTVSPTPAPTPSPTPTPETPADSTNSLEAVETIAGRSHVATYSAATADVVLQGDPTVTEDRIKVVDIVYHYPRGDAVAWGTSEELAPPRDGETERVSVELSSGSVPQDQRVHHLAFAMPASETVDSVQTSQFTFLYESDPFEFESSSDEVSRSPPAHLPDDGSEERFERGVVEGAFTLDFDGQTDGQSWTVGFFVWKSAYSESFDEPRGRGYDEYVAVAQNDGVAKTFADIMDSEAEASGFTGKREKVNFVVDWVQSLPYVTDDVSRGFDEYPKLLTETLVDAAGDCEDTAILLAAVLQTEPFGYDMVLIQPPGHMAAGIYGTDLPGYYWEKNGRQYYYIETTGTGWGIGDLPEPYENEDAFVYQV